MKECKMKNCEGIEKPHKCDDGDIDCGPDLVATLDRAKQIIIQTDGYNDGNFWHTKTVEDIEELIAKIQGK